MSFQRELEESYADLECNRIMDRRKAVEKITDLLGITRVVECVNNGDPLTWNMLLEGSQNCLRKECEKIAETTAKKGVPKAPDRNFHIAKDFFVLVVKTAIKHDEEHISISKLIRYIDGCLKDKKMRLCRNDFLLLLKDSVLPNSNCLGYFEPEDFELLFKLLKSELENRSTSKFDDIVVFNCFSLLIKYGPLSSFPSCFLREQFPFISKLCQSVTQNYPRPQQEDMVEIALNFSKHTAEDNRLSCTKLGEELFTTMLDLYFNAGHDSLLKVNFIEFCLLQMTIHNPNGATEGDSQSFASNWHNWKTCIKKMYSLLTLEVSSYLRQCVKNTLFFIPQGDSTVILDSFVLLFVEVCKQLFKDAESPMNYTMLESFDVGNQSQKRRKVEASLESFVSEIQETKSWVWIKLIGALLNKYPELIDEKLFKNLLQILQTLQLEVKDSNTISYIYECQAILLNVEKTLNLTNTNEDWYKLWKLVGDSTLRAVGLNQNVKETQTLLQKLISRGVINLDAVIQTYTSGVLIITEHHLNTLQMVLQNINFPQLEHSMKQNIFSSLLNSQNVKDYLCFLKPSFAQLLVTFMLKQCPDLIELTNETPTDHFENLTMLYRKSSFKLKDLLNKSSETGIVNKRSYNIDSEIVTSITNKLHSVVDHSNSEPIDRQLCIVGLLYNVLSYMLNYSVINENEVHHCPVYLLMEQILTRESLVVSFESYKTHNEKVLKNLLKVASILSDIFLIKNNVTEVVKSLFTLDFLKAVVSTLDYFHVMAERKAELEHKVKLALVDALSKYCLVSNSTEMNRNQFNIIRVLSKPDYDFKTDTDYDLSLTFLTSIKYANAGYLPVEAITQILDCLQGMCSARYRSYKHAIDILSVIKDLYKQFKKFQSVEEQTRAVILVNPFYMRLEYYGPDVALAILNCIGELCKADPDCTFSTWADKDVIKYVPNFLSSNFQRVRFRAIEVLVDYFRITTGSTKLQNVHRLEEIFNSMYEMNVKVFEVEGELTEERRHDEVIFRTTSALYTYVMLMTNCSNWVEESLFALIRLEHNKKLFGILDGELLKRVLTTLKEYFQSEEFMKKYLENILNRWINMGYDINQFEVKFFNCTDKIDLYLKYFDICLPILLKKDRNDLFSAAKQLKMNEREVLERCCTKIFGRALSNDINNVNSNFLERNVEVSYMSHILGDRLNEILLENINDVIVSLLSVVTDEKLIAETFGEIIIFANKGITFEQFGKCLRFIQDLLFNGNELISSLSSKRLNKLQKILLALQVKSSTAIADDQLKCFHQYTIFVDLIVKNLNKNSSFLEYFLRDTIYYLVHLTKNDQYKELSSVLKYIDSFLSKIFPDHIKEFENLFIFTVNSIKNIAILHDGVSKICIKILEFLIVDNAVLLAPSIEKLDAFPPKTEFEKIKTVHKNIKYGKNEVSLEDEIKLFLEYDDISTRQDSLVHLKTLLSQEKQQLKLLYEKLDSLRGFSEDCETSTLHRLTCMLVKMSVSSSKSICQEAIKCLGELGPANLTTLVLEPEKKVLNMKCTSFELLTGHVISLLSQYIVDSDINVIKSASDALYKVLKSKEGKKVIDSEADFGYGPINKNYIIPFISTPDRTASHVGIDFEMFSVMINDSQLWCPSQTIGHTKWLTYLVVALLNSFEDGCYLKSLLLVCEVKAKFCEHILPLVIYLLLSLNNKRVTETLSRQINGFFEEHWKLTTAPCTKQELIAVDKKSVRCMLDVVNFVRQQLSFTHLPPLKLNYLPISKAAAFCSAHFTALLYAELWCQEKIATQPSHPSDSTSIESGYSLLDFIYESESEEIGFTLHSILQNAYKSIGDLDALSGCGISFLLRPEYRVEHYKNMGQWEQVMLYYSRQTTNKRNSFNLLESFKMNQLYQLPLLCTQLSENPQYECLWRLGQWSTNKKDNLKDAEVRPENYEKYKFYSLKSLCDEDEYTYLESKKQLNMCIINNLKHTSIESSKNLYPILSQLQSVVEMDDFKEALINKGFNELFNKWKVQDEIIRKNDFHFVEPITAQRITMLNEYVKKKEVSKQSLFDLILSFADYAKAENFAGVAENVIINIRNIPELDSNIQNELNFREAQLAWLNNDKVIAQQLLKKLTKSEDIAPRLKASALKLQGEYMAELYFDRTAVQNCFSSSVKILKEMTEPLTHDDCTSLQDTFDKLATFADREYQQIMNHIKSDLFQRKISNMKQSREMAKSIIEQRKKTDDEKKAAVIHDKQSKIDENEINSTKKEKDKVLSLALRFYIKNLSLCDTNNIKIFRVISLFLENRENQQIANDIEKYLPEIPSYKYITMLPQIIPHISDSSPDLFSRHVNIIIEKCSLDHPHHTLPLLLALVNANKDKEYSQSKTKLLSNDRSVTATSMVKKLKKKSELSQIIDKMQLLSDALIELAYFVDAKAEEDLRKEEYSIPSKLKIHRIKNFNDILVPTVTVPVSKTNSYRNIPGIVKFSPTYKRVGGINAPKRIECQSTLGKNHPQLVKGQDDLRQDAVMQQVFSIMTNLLSSNKQTRNLLIRTYKIVPLSMRSGILEWVTPSMPIGEYLTGNKQYVGAHKQFRPNDITPADCKTRYRKTVGRTNEQKLEIYNGICKVFKPVMHKFFETHFLQPSVWYERKRAYIHSVATTSMCGYILGIGDRHVSNILIDKQTAEVIHIDFGIAFEQGKILPTSETVPFRLSRDIVDGMGVSGIEGLFRKSCEKTMEVLRANSQTILTILEVLLYDPLYFWTVSPAEANKRQTEDDSYRGDNEESEEENRNVSADRALLRLRGKLQGTEEGKVTSVEQQVGTLIQQAMDPANLCRLFYGWQPYL